MNVIVVLRNLGFQFYERIYRKIPISNKANNDVFTYCLITEWIFNWKHLVELVEKHQLDREREQESDNVIIIKNNIGCKHFSAENRKHQLKWSWMEQTFVKFQQQNMDTFFSPHAIRTQNYPPT